MNGFYTELIAKRIEVLTEMLPRLPRVALRANCIMMCLRLHSIGSQCGPGAIALGEEVKTQRASDGDDHDLL